MHSTASSTDSEDCDENYVPMVSNMSTDEPVCNTQLSHDLYSSKKKSQIIDNKLCLRDVALRVCRKRLVLTTEAP